MKVEWSLASTSDAARLAAWNRELIREEGHRNAMDLAQLERRMYGWLRGEYQAVIFRAAGEPVGYALFRPTSTEIHLRQFFIIRDRRRVGLGRKCMTLLREDVWPQDIRLTVDVLCHNATAISFWRAMGYQDYALTLEIMPERS